MEDKTETVTNPPFRDNLVEGVFTTPYKRHLLDLENHPDLVIREERTPAFDTEDEVVDYYTNYKRNLLRLRNDYGINVPKFQIVISGKRSPEEIRAYFVVEKIKGRTLSQIDPKELFQVVSPLMDQNYAGFVRYWHNAWKNKDRDIIADVIIHPQYVYGKSKEDQKNKVYMVDIGPNVRINHVMTDMEYLDTLHVLSRRANEYSFLRDATKREIESFLTDIEQTETLGDSNRNTINQIRETLHPPQP